MVKFHVTTLIIVTQLAFMINSVAGIPIEWVVWVVILCAYPKYSRINERDIVQLESRAGHHGFKPVMHGTENMEKDVEKDVKKHGGEIVKHAAHEADDDGG